MLRERWRERYAEREMKDSRRTLFSSFFLSFVYSAQQKPAFPECNRKDPKRPPPREREGGRGRGVKREGEG
jgi:hypothetical protein